MKNNGITILLYLLFLVLFSCNSSGDSSQKSGTTASNTKATESKVVAPVVVDQPESDTKIAVTTPQENKQAEQSATGTSTTSKITKEVNTQTAKSTQTKSGISKTTGSATTNTNNSKSKTIVTKKTEVITSPKKVVSVEKPPKKEIEIEQPPKKEVVAETPPKKKVETKVPPKPKNDPPKVDVSTSQGASASESTMISEINRLRKNPAAYASEIQNYLSYFEKENFQNLADEKQTAQELISALKSMASLPPLEFHKGLHTVAVQHGKYLQSQGMVGISNPHRGSGGSDLTARTAGLSDLTTSTENFGTSHDNPKYQLISLLVDAGVSGRGHRKNILDPNINVVAPYRIGQIADFPGCWIQLFGKKKGSTSTTTSTSNEPALTFAAGKKLVDKASYMSAKEREMLNEINELRSNPKGYIPKIEAYLVKLKSGEIWSMTSVADETQLANSLINDLKTMAPLSVLRPDPKIYQVAVTHGNYLKANGNAGNPHAGAGGKGAHTRISEGSDMSKGGENYQGTVYGVQETLIGLLIDAGISTLGHRKALLNPAWTHGACRQFGPVMTAGISQADNWLQNFGAK